MLRVGQRVRCVMPESGCRDIHRTHGRVGVIVEGEEAREVHGTVKNCYVVLIAGVRYNALESWLEVVQAMKD
jgi:hypothetical protein